jgi:hypothetical protein
MGLLGSLAALVARVGDSVQQRVERFDEDRVLRMHRRRLGEALKKGPRKAWPIRGEVTPSGFVQRTGGRQMYLLAITGMVIAFGVFWLLRRALIGFGEPGWNWVPLLAIALFGVVIGVIVYAFFMDSKGFAALWVRGELTVERWPLRTGEPCAVRYRASARGRRAIVKARAALRCEEGITWHDTSRKGRDGRSLAVHNASLGEATPSIAADGSITVTWSVQIPSGAPPSLDGETTRITWEIVVEVQAEGAIATTQEFSMLVIPGTA